VTSRSEQLLPVKSGKFYNVFDNLYHPCEIKTTVIDNYKIMHWDEAVLRHNKLYVSHAANF